MRYRLRTLMIVLTLGPPMLAWAWFYTVPVVTSLAFLLLLVVLAACLFGAVLGRTLLWGIEGILAVANRLIAILRQAARRRRPLRAEDAVEFSLSRFASKIRARRRE